MFLAHDYTMDDHIHNMVVIKRGFINPTGLDQTAFERPDFVVLKYQIYEAV